MTEDVKTWNQYIGENKKEKTIQMTLYKEIDCSIEYRTYENHTFKL
jgi:hypothetical protein